MECLASINYLADFYFLHLEGHQTIFLRGYYQFHCGGGGGWSVKSNIVSFVSIHVSSRKTRKDAYLSFLAKF